MGLIEPPELLRRHRLSVDDYYRMAEAGVLAPDARVELIDGEWWTWHRSEPGMRALLRGSIGDSQPRRARRLVWVQLPLRLDRYSEPEPDLMLLRPRADYYATAHPTAADVLLLIEVSDTSARYDREIKLPLYAAHGVAEVWIVDLERNVLRMFRRPVDGQYTENVETASPGKRAPAALPAAAIELGDLLVPAP